MRSLLSGYFLECWFTSNTSQLVTTHEICRRIVTPSDDQSTLTFDPKCPDMVDLLSYFIGENIQGDPS